MTNSLEITYEDGTTVSLDTSKYRLPCLLKMAGDGSLDMLIDMFDPHGEDMADEIE